MKYIVLIVGFLQFCNAKNIIILKDTNKAISLEQLVSSISDYPIIFVGDHHDTIETHKFFKLFLDELIAKNYTIHLANEWFTPKHNHLLKLYTEDIINSEELKKKRLWHKEISTRWKLAEMIYETVKKSSGKLYGISMPKEMREKISLKSFEKMSPKEKSFYHSLDFNNSSHKSFVMPLFSTCCKNKPQKKIQSCKISMYRVQVAWDTYMAQESAKLASKVLKIEQNKLIIFAGTVHVKRDLGIPLRFKKINQDKFFILTNKKVQNISDELNISQIQEDAIFIYDSK